MEFGKKYRVGNYMVVKLRRNLTQREMSELRKWIPEEMRETLPKRYLPYIKVSTVSGNWAVEFGITERMFQALDDAKKEEWMDGETLGMLSNLFSGMYVDTSILGDKVYNEEKSKALKGYFERSTNVGEETDEMKASDDGILESMKKDMENEDAMMRMAKEVADGE